MPVLCPKCNKNFIGDSGKLCIQCALSQDDAKMRRDLLTSFSGKGKRGLLQFLRLGKFLQQCETAEDVTLYNDRLRIIQGMVGGAEIMEIVVAKLVDYIAEIAEAKALGSEEPVEPAT